MSAPPRKPAPIARAPGAAGKRPAPIVRRAPLPAFERAPDPIDDAKLPGDLQGDAEGELDQVQAGFRERMKAEADRFKTATDGSYYFVVALESGEQASALLAALGVQPGASDLFVDGRRIADHLGVKLPKADIRYNAAPKIDPKLARLVRKPGAL